MNLGANKVILALLSVLVVSAQVIQDEVTAQMKLENALLKAKEAMVELQAVLDEASQLEVTVDKDDDNVVVPAKFTDVIQVLGNLEAVDDALREQEQLRLDRRNAERMGAVDKTNKEAVRNVSFSESAFFQVQRPAIDQIDKAAEKIQAEEEEKRRENPAHMASVAKELDDKLSLVDAKVADSLVGKPSASTAMIAMARLKQELRRADILDLAKYDHEATLKATYLRINSLASCAVKSVTTALQISKGDLSALKGFMDIFQDVDNLLKLMNELADDSLDVAENLSFANAFSVLNRMSGNSVTGTYQATLDVLHTGVTAVKDIVKDLFPVYLMA